MSSAERRATSRTQEEMSSTTRTTTKHKMLVPMHPRAKHHRAANSHHDLDTEDDTEESDDIPLSKADIPTILNAVLSTISSEGSSSRDDNQDISHLDE